jgi:hypothetical protein
LSFHGPIVSRTCEPGVKSVRASRARLAGRRSVAAHGSTGS